MSKTIELTQMVGTATLSLFAETQNEELFKSILHHDVLIDAKFSVLTHEGEIIELDVIEILNME